MKFIAGFSILLAVLLFSVSSNADDWRGETDTFDIHTVKLGKGIHVFFAIGNQPVTCAVFRGGIKLLDRNVDGGCQSTFVLDREETIQVIVIHAHWQPGITKFGYHGAIMSFPVPEAKPVAAVQVKL